MNELKALLEKLSYKQLVKICEEEGLQKSGRKSEVLKRVLENVPEEKLRAHVLEFMGFSGKILEHELVPKHRIMGEDEVKELLERLGIKKWQLPKILESDPVAMVIGARAGDVIEITRKSPTAGEAKYYRVVVKSRS